MEMGMPQIRTQSGHVFDFEFPVVILLVPGTGAVETVELNDRWRVLPVFSGESEAEEFTERMGMPYRDRCPLDRHQFIRVLQQAHAGGTTSIGFDIRPYEEGADNPRSRGFYCSVDQLIAGLEGQ
jgi:hypothetical protein